MAEQSSQNTRKLAQIAEQMFGPLSEAIDHLPHLALSNYGKGRYDCGGNEHCFTHKLIRLRNDLAKLLGRENDDYAEDEEDL